jgi:anaerobic dimethyl sulfoxide reductase subunit B (iron-sulfur subunit)
MTRRLGFRVDVASCVGCKACQIACQDRHDLGPDLRRRRVVEVTGGQWTRRGELWIDETRSWFVSVACMHCARPICAEVCPTKAMGKREDGIVTVEAERCMGCRYCEWACPYAAPRFDEDAGVMTKCDLCRDRLAEGRDPACVAACPLRVLSVADFAEEAGGDSELFPLPPAALTEPSAAWIPHRDVAPGATGSPRIGNREEI